MSVSIVVLRPVGMMEDGCMRLGRRIFATVVITAAMMVGGLGAKAATISFTNEANFLNAVGPTTLENFETIPTDTTKRTTIATPFFEVTTTPTGGGTSFLFVGMAGGGPFPTDGVNALMARSITGDTWFLTFNLVSEVNAVGLDLTDAAEQGDVSIGLA